MGTYICSDCGDRVEYSGGVPVRYLCSDCTDAREWESLEWVCVECGHVREISTYYEPREKSPLRMVCAGCSTTDDKMFRDFEVL